MSSNPRIPYRLSNMAPKLVPPKNKPLIVHIVVNLEHWQFDQPMPRKILPAPQGLESVPDVPNFCWVEYGMRCGMPRLLDLFTERSLPISASINASVVDVYPECAEAILDKDWEFIAHGMYQRSIEADANDEARIVNLALEKLRAFSGKKIRGWLSPGLRETNVTPDLLKAAGIEYVFDWILDDIPCWMSTEKGPLIAMPYSPEINDSVVYAIERHSSPEIFNRLRDTLQCFDRELEKGPRIITLGLHPHLIAVPHRILYLENMLDLLQERKDVIFMKGGQIADWFTSAQE